MHKHLHSKRIRFCLYLISGTVLAPLLLFLIANQVVPAARRKAATAAINNCSRPPRRMAPSLHLVRRVVAYP